MHTYIDQFRAFLSKPGARLTVIGYGFMDTHINQVMVEAWEHSKFPMMIVMPCGRDILKKINPTYGKMYFPGPLEQITAYDSTRPISSTFGSCDEAEVTPLGPFDRSRVRRWLDIMTAEFGPIMSWLPS